ncbi:MAG: conjugal transfer protein [Thermoleophilia bacterium]|nr:conjugal transfer protein [Thermoleophilia bacterium]
MRFAKTDSTARAALRGVGRFALWTALGLLFARAVLSEPGPGAPRQEGERLVGVDPASAGFAVRFASTYLADPRAVVPLLAEGAKLATGRPPTAPGAEVAQAEVVGIENLGGGRAVLTVACQLRDARVLNLAVPIVRSRAGEVAALGAPSIVAAPSAAGVASTERPQPIAGPDAEAIEALIAKFLPEYVATSERASLAYLLTPAARVRPLAGSVSLDAIAEVRQLGSEDGPRRSVVVSARLGIPAGGGSYPAVYRLELRRTGAEGRWYVEAIVGAGA